MHEGYYKAAPQSRDVVEQTYLENIPYTLHGYYGTFSYLKKTKQILADSDRGL
jgi:hypothetical protein